MNAPSSLPAEQLAAFAAGPRFDPIHKPVPGHTLGRDETAAKALRPGAWSGGATARDMRQAVEALAGVHGMNCCAGLFSFPRWAKAGMGAAQWPAPRACTHPSPAPAGQGAKTGANP